MNLKTLFGKSIKTMILDLTIDILNEQWQREISLSKIESLGILDGKEIIFEFLDHHENGCTYEHLAYVVSESNIALTTDQITEMDKLAKILNIKN